MADDIKLVIGVEDRDLIRAQKEQVKFQRNLITIEKSFRSGDITARRYNQELAKQAKELQKLGGSYNKANSEVRKFAYQLRSADDASLSAAESYAFAGKKVNRLGVGLQQAGYQVGDFAVQIQGGTNAMVALGQQGSQLLGIFGAGGAIAGAGLAIATAFLAPLFRAQEEAKNLETSLEDLGSSAEKLSRIRFNSLGDSLVGPIKEAKEEFQNLLNLMEAQELKALKDKLEAPFRAVVAELTSFQKLSDVRARLGGPTPDFDSELGLSNRNEALFLATQLKRLEGETSEELASQLDSITEALELRGILTEEVQGILVKMAEEIGLLEIIEEKTEAAGENVKKQNEAHTEAESRLNRISLIMSQIRRETEDTANAAANFASNMSLRNLQSAGLSGAVFSGGERNVGRGSSGVVDNSYQQELGYKSVDEVVAELTKSRSGGAATKADPLKTLQDRIALEQELLGKTEAQQRVIQALGVNWQDYSATALSGIFETIEEMDRLNQKAAEQEQISKTIESSMNTAFMSMVDGTKSVSDAFKDMARAIIADLYQIYVVKKITGMITGAIGGAMAGPVQGPMVPSANGNVFSGGSQVKAFANGGVVNGPTTFPMAGGKTGLMGEAGPEAIMPLKRGANGKLGVQMEGGSQGNVVVNQSFNFSANGDESVKKLIAQAAPQIANMTQKQILDSRRRGGAMKSTFG